MSHIESMWEIIVRNPMLFVMALLLHVLFLLLCLGIHWWARH